MVITKITVLLILKSYLLSFKQHIVEFCVQIDINF